MKNEEKLGRMKILSLYYHGARGDIIEIYIYIHDRYSENPNLQIIKQESITRGHELSLWNRYCKTT